jgi:hypothetical protein
VAERNLERFAVGIVIIFILSLTPLISWLMDTTGVQHQWWGVYVERIVTGILLYIAAMYAISGLDDEDTVEVEGDPGKLTVNKFMLLAGVILIGIGWLTDISSYIVSTFHLTWWVSFNGIVYKITTIQEKLILAAFTFVGAFLIKRSFSRRDREEKELPDTTDLYEKTKRRGR